MSMGRFMVAACFVGSLLVASPLPAQEVKRADKVSFYFAAHEDDWQLFMNPSAFEDVTGGAAKTVFVHLTGSAGTISERINARVHEYMPATLLASQLETLEAPEADERHITVAINTSPELIADQVLKQLGRVQLTP